MLDRHFGEHLIGFKRMSIKGGLSALDRNSKGQPRRVTTRAVNGIDQDQRLNRALWLLAEILAGHKGH